jgi:hypothetical protein
MAIINEIDLKTMIPSTNRKDKPVGDGNRKQKTTFKDGELILQAPGDLECMQTEESYSFPLRIDATIKTDSSNIRLYYKDGKVIINWEINKDSLRIHDILTGRGYGYNGKGRVPENEYVDIAWIIDRNETLLIINDELRQYDESYPYMESRAVTQNKKICEPVRISAAWGSMITVKSLKVTELD